MRRASIPTRVNRERLELARIACDLPDSIPLDWRQFMAGMRLPPGTPTRERDTVRYLMRAVAGLEGRVSTGHSAVTEEG